MEIEESGNKRNETLSLSYIQGVGRVAQQNNDVGFGFELPKEVLQKREKVWDNLFDKYADEVSDEIELNIDTMEPVATADEEEEGEENEEDEVDEEDEEPEEYYSKCRAPMKKHSALIQYWIDTGNPPYKLEYEANSGTGSSLSEGENSDIVEEPNEKPRFEDLSPYSSVDTAAYILSNNKNITKKSETLAIVEGSKKSEAEAKKAEEKKNLSYAEEKQNLSYAEEKKNLPYAEGKKNPSYAEEKRNPSYAEEKKNLSYEEKNSPTIKNSSISKENISAKNFTSSHQNLTISSHQSVKLSEVLPTFKQFDDIFEASQIRKSPKIHRREKIIEKKKISLISKSLTKSKNRRKLYTGRDSPVDLESTQGRRRNFYSGRDSPIDLPIEDNGESLRLTKNFHPALDLINNEKKSNSRVRARRKRKRLSKMENFEDNTSQESETQIGNRISKGDERYTDFFESLGLTPSKTIIGENSIKKFQKRRKKIENFEEKRKIKKIKLSETLESSIKETDTSQLSEKFIEKNNENEKIGNEKILKVKIEKLSDDLISRYCRKNSDGIIEENSVKKNRENFEENSSKNRENFEENSAKKNRKNFGENSSKKNRENLEENSSKKNRENLEENSSKKNQENLEENSSKKNRENIEENSSKNRENSLKKNRENFEENSSKKNRENLEENSSKKNRENLEENSLKKNREYVEENSSKKNQEHFEENSSKKNQENFEENLSKKNQENFEENSSKKNQEKSSKKNRENFEENSSKNRENFEEKSSKKNRKNVEENSLKKNRKNIEENIELLNMANQDSDSSTILICACNNENTENYSDSENSLITKKVQKKLSKIEKEELTRSLRSKKSKLPTKNNSKKNFSPISEKSKNSKIELSKSPKLYVSLEKLSMKTPEKNNFSPDKNSKSKINLMNFYGKSPEKSDKNFLTIGTKSNEKILKKLPLEKNSRLSISSDEDEDSFVKIVKKNFDTKKKLIGNENLEKSTKKLTKNNFEISVQSDDDLSTKNMKKNKSVEKNSKIGIDKNFIDESKGRRKKIEIEDKIVRRSTRQKNVTTDEIFPNLINRQESNEKSAKIDKVEKSKNRTKLFTKIENTEKKSIGNCLNLARFQTRLDSDSDTDFESLRFSINPNFEKSKEIQEKNSLRRSFRNLNESKLKSEEKNSSETKKNESISEKSNNSQNSSKNVKKSKMQDKEKNLLKSDRLRNSSKISPSKKSLKIEEKNEISLNPRKKLRSTKIFSTIEYESDDDKKLIKKNSNSIENREKLNLSNDNNNSLKKIREKSKNLFSNVLDETGDDIDNLFSVDRKSKGKQCKVVIDSLNFVNSNKHKNFYLRQSTISFRTRLRSDSEDENLS